MPDEPFPRAKRIARLSSLRPASLCLLRPALPSFVPLLCARLSVRFEFAHPLLYPQQARISTETREIAKI